MVVGEAARVLAVTLRRSGRAGGAVSLLTRTAAGLDAGDPRTRAVRGALRLTAAYSAAVGGQRQASLDLVEAAAGAARRAREELFTTHFDRAQVEVYGVSIHTALGDGAAARSCARRVVPSRLPTDERRARYWTDVARMWWAEGESGRAFEALRAVEAVAPQEVRRPAVRALTADVLCGPGRVPGLREFAARTGARPT